jgi:solute carrier family 25, member 33/36
LQSSNRELQKGHPLEVAKTIMKQDGPAGFFRGLPPTLVGIIPSRSAYFYAYNRLKSFLNPTLPEGSPPNALIAGFLAGIVSNTLTNPIWMVRTRMQLLIDHTAGQKQYAGYGDAIQTIWKEEGIGGFYKGVYMGKCMCREKNVCTDALIQEKEANQVIE